jgi:hypothetical protein
MATARPTKPDIVTYGDYEVITPDARHLHRSSRAAEPDEPDPVIKAEEALAQISNEFETWMAAECDRLDIARHKARDSGLAKQTKQDLFLAAHDLKGDSGTFGYPEVVPAAGARPGPCQDSDVDHRPARRRGARHRATAWPP